jgi:hypothetical protein
MKDDSKRGRVERKGSVRHAHLDVNGMDIDVEPEDLTTNGDLHEVIVDGAPKPLRMSDHMWQHCNRLGSCS